MKILFLVCFAAMFPRIVFSQTESETLRKADDLVAEKKYESAFKVLREFDPKDQKPDAVLLKEDIVLKYFVTSIMHQVFALKDLEKNEDVLDYRGKEGSYGMYVFEIDSILNGLIKRYPKNYRLYKGLGDYYTEVNRNYQGHWLKDEDELEKLIKKNYKIAIDNGVADAHTYYSLGYVYLTEKKYKEAIPYFLKSIEMKNDYADAQYNLAYAYLFTDDRVHAIEYAKNSIGLYKDADLKGDAARIVAQSYRELKDDKNALKYYEEANAIDSGNYENLKPLVEYYLKTNNPKKKAMLAAFYELAPEKPTIYNDLIEIYSDSEKSLELIDFFKSKIPEHQADKKISGNLHFYLGELYLDSDKKAAKQHLLEARKIFAEVYEKDHAVFKEIDKGIKQAEEE